MSNIAAGSTSYDYKFMQQVAAEQYGIDFDNLVSTYQQTLAMANQKIAYDTNQQVADQDLYEQESRQISAEANKGLSTGASAIRSQDITETVEQNKQNIIEQGEQLSQKTAQDVLASLGTVMESLFGDVDKSGRFTEIVKYEQTAEVATEGMFMAIASDLFAKDLTEVKDANIYKGGINSSNYNTYLQEKGILEVSEDGQTFALTDYGYQVLDSVVNNWTFHDDANIRKKYINSMIDAELGSGMASELELNNLEKYNSYVAKYEGFISQYMGTWRYTSLGLWSGDTSNPSIDTIYSSDEYDSTVHTEEINKYKTNQTSENSDITSKYFGSTADIVGEHTIIKPINKSMVTSRQSWDKSYAEGDDVQLIIDGTEYRVEVSNEVINLPEYAANFATGDIVLIDSEFYIVDPSKQFKKLRTSSTIFAGNRLNRAKQKIGIS